MGQNLYMNLQISYYNLFRKQQIIDGMLNQFNFQKNQIGQFRDKNSLS